jgi:hypothetical protein
MRASEIGNGTRFRVPLAKLKAERPMSLANLAGTRAGPVGSEGGAFPPWPGNATEKWIRDRRRYLSSWQPSRATGERERRVSSQSRAGWSRTGRGPAGSNVLLLVSLSLSLARSLALAFPLLLHSQRLSIAHLREPSRPCARELLISFAHVSPESSIPLSVSPTATFILLSFNLHYCNFVCGHYTRLFPFLSRSLFRSPLLPSRFLSSPRYNRFSFSPFKLSCILSFFIISLLLFFYTIAWLIFL